MTTTAAIIGLAALSYALRAVRLLVPEDNPHLDRYATPLTAAVLASLIVSPAITSGTDLTFDARLAGLAVAIVAATARLPLTITLVLAVAATALARLLT